jgi:cytochrome c oxidase assembly protein subunit 15
VGALLRVTPRVYQRVTGAALAALVFIVVTGAAVRLTGSGLGCPDWPTCNQGRIVAPLEYHAMVEFVNRTVTGAVSIAVIVAVLGAFWRVPRRADLVWLSLGLVAGVAAQVVLGGLTVLFHLAPPIVMGHFLLSMVLIANAVALHERAARPDGAVARSRAPAAIRAMAGSLVGGATVVLVTGTVVTASGPHGGDTEAARLDFFVPDVARVHGASVVVFLVITIATLLASRRVAAPTVARRGTTLLVVVVAQAAVCYTQYFTGVPVLLVGVHVAGAVAVWIASLRFFLGTREHVPPSMEHLSRAPERLPVGTP